MHEHDPVQDDGKQKIRHWSGNHDRGAPPDALAIEGAMGFGSRHRTFPSVEHLHVAAQWQCRD
jgi:hypothetical protein